MLNLKAHRLKLEDVTSLLLGTMWMYEDEESDNDAYIMGLMYDRVDEAIEKLKELIKDVEYEL